MRKTKVKPVMRTYTGILFNLLKPNLLHIELEDIAHGLSGEGRYSNQSSVTVPVAAHALTVADVIAGLFATDARLQFAALNHDDSEAYTNDMPAPLKHQVSLGGFKKVEDGIQGAIAKRYDFYHPKPEIIGVWDQNVRRVEQWLYMRGHKQPETIREFGTKALFINGETANNFIASKLRSYVALNRNELKAEFTERFHSLRTAACFALPAVRDGCYYSKQVSQGV